MSAAIATVIALPYEVARLPLVLLDRTLSDKLSEISAPRLALDRALGSADKFAGAVLHNDTIRRRGVDRLERSDQRLAAGRLEEHADAQREQAQEVADSTQDEAAEKRTAARRRAATGRQEADAAEAQGKQAATTAAATTAATKKAAADQRAKSRSATAEQRRRRADSAATATKKVAQGRAKAKLDEARETKAAAADAKADADRLDELTTEKAEERKRD